MIVFTVSGISDSFDLFLPSTNPFIQQTCHILYLDLKKSTTRSQSSNVVMNPSEMRTAPAITPFTTVSAVWCTQVEEKHLWFRICSAIFSSDRPSAPYAAPGLQCHPARNYASRPLATRT